MMIIPVGKRKKMNYENIVGVPRMAHNLKAGGQKLGRRGEE